LSEQFYDELIGEPSLKRGNFVTGVKRLPIRFTRA
jgi:hypothetical protein